MLPWTRTKRSLAPTDPFLCPVTEDARPMHPGARNGALFVRIR